MNTIREVSAGLKAALEQRKLTQRAVREAAGISKQTFANVFSGKEDYKLSTLLSLADKLGLDLLLLPKEAARGLSVSRTNSPAVESFVDRALKGAKGARSPNTHEAQDENLDAFSRTALVGDHPTGKGRVKR